MKLQKVYGFGKILNRHLYKYLQALDQRCFPNCGDEFLINRDWWVMVDGKKIVAYCGCLYRDGVCVFVRAWVHKDYRGNGIQRQMIKARLKAAKAKECSDVVTYTTWDNYPSANNLIKCGFLLHNPAFQYAGPMMYFKKKI